MKIELDEQVSKKAIELLRKTPENFKKAVGISLARIGQEMRGEGARLAPYKTGKLRQSITVDPPNPKERVVVGTNLIYARVQDQGATITPKRAKYLVFQVGGRWVRAKKVVVPAFKGRGYLTPAFQTQANGRAGQIFTEELNQVINA